MSMQAQDCIDIEQIKTDLSNIVDKCSCDDPLVLGVPNQTTFISTYQLGTVIQNKCIEVYGTLVIDQSTSFRYCDFIMDDGSLIETNASLVSIVECNLQSCGNYFWDGIWVETSRTLIFRENTMQDAFNGIHNLGGYVSCFISNNVFNNNHFSIRLNSHPDLSTYSYLILNGNIFGQSDDLKVHWEIPPNNFHRLSTGVKVENGIVNSLVGNDPCTRTNVFVGLSNGYQLFNSVSQIESDLFHDFLEYWGDPPLAGNGISTDITDPSMVGSSSLRQSGWPTNHIETFNYVPISIHSRNSTIVVKNNIIDNVASQPIWNISPIGMNIIRDNDINFGGIGLGAVVVHNTYNNVISNIINNRIQVQNRTLNAGMYLWNSISASNTRGQILSNRVNLNDFGTGIWLNTANLFNVSCNTVNIGGIWDSSNEALGVGVLLRGGSNNRLVENTVNGQYQLNHPVLGQVNGIKIEESQANLLKSNYVNNTQIGLHFSNWNSNTMQENNSMANHDVGYYVSETGVTGDQFFAGNKWLGSFNDWAALNDGESHLSRYYDHQNFVGTSCWPSSISPMGGWFIPEQSLGTCINPIFITNCIEEAEPEWPAISELYYLDSLVAKGDLGFENFPARRTWQTQRYLLRNLMDFPDLVGSNGSLMDSFLIEAQNSSLWDYHQMRNLIDDYSSMPQQLEDLWYNYYGQYEDLVEDAEVAISNWLDHPDSLALTAAITNIYEEIDSIWSVSAAAVQSWRANSINNLNSLLPHIANLNTPNLYATSEKLIMEATIKMAESTDSLSESLVNNLIQLSESCLLEYGPSVIDARGIVKFLDYSIAPVELNCSQGSELRRINSLITRSPAFEMYPNPNTGLLNLKFESEIIDNGVLELYETVGKLVFSKTISTSSGIVQVSVDHLPPGQYNVKVKINNTEEVQSLIITR